MREEALNEKKELTAIALQRGARFGKRGEVRCGNCRGGYYINSKKRGCVVQGLNVAANMTCPKIDKRKT